MSLCTDCGAEIVHGLAPSDSHDEILCSRCTLLESEMVCRGLRHGSVEVPVEDCSSKPFGLGFAEIPSSAITQALAADHPAREPRDPDLPLVAMVIGIWLLGAAAILNLRA